MHLHHPEGTNQAQAQTSRVLAQYDSAVSGGTRSPLVRCRSGAASEGGFNASLKWF